MSELWAPWKYVVSFNPHIPLKTISMVFFLPYYPGGFPRWYSGECIHLSMQETKEMWVQSLGREILWRRKCLPTQVFLPGKFHGQRSLESSSLWGGKELYMTERLTHTHTHTHTHVCRDVSYFYIIHGENEAKDSGQMTRRDWYGMQIQFLWF